MSLLRALRERDLALLWGALSLSAIGDQLYMVALSWIAVSAFGAAAGFLTALQAAVVLLAALGVGRWADGWEPQGSLIGADLARAAALALLVAAWLSAGSVSAAALVGVVIVLAAGQAVFQPALQVVMPGLISDRALLPAANALLDTTDRSARLLGPGMIALLAGLIPTVHFFSLDAGSFLLSAAAVRVIRTRRQKGSQHRDWRPTAQQGLWQSLRRGAGAIAAHRLMGFVLRTTAVINGAWYATYFLALPLLIAQRGLHGPGGTELGAYGLVIAAYGSTNLLATLVLGGRAMPARPQFQMFGGTLIVGLGMALLGAAALLPARAALAAIAAAAALSAIGGPMKDIPFAVLRQTRLAAADLPAAMRAYIAANAAGTLAALLISPALLRGLGAVGFIVLCGLLVAGIELVGLVRYRSWREA